MKTLTARIVVGIVAIAALGGGAVVVTGRAGDRPTVVQAVRPAPDQVATPPSAAPTTAPSTTTTTAPTTTTTTAAPTTTTTAPTTTTTTTTTVLPPASTTTTVPTPPAEPAQVTLRRGDEGPAVRALQGRLRELGYWLGSADGTYGRLTEQAVTAFQKVEGLGRDGVAGPATRAALAAADRPRARSGGGNRIEVDKARQVVLVVRGGRVAWALNTSTGTEQPYRVGGRTELADTPPGRWTVSWVVDGNDVGELGPLYRPRYFHGDGIAVHGYHSVPAYPASHGCVRVTEAAMDWIWAENLMPMGSEVWVY